MCDCNNKNKIVKNSCERKDCKIPCDEFLMEADAITINFINVILTMISGVVDTTTLDHFMFHLFGVGGLVFIDVIIDTYIQLINRSLLLDTKKSCNLSCVLASLDNVGASAQNAKAKIVGQLGVIEHTTILIAIMSIVVEIALFTHNVLVTKYVCGSHNPFGDSGLIPLTANISRSYASFKNASAFGQQDQTGQLSAFTANATASNLNVPDTTESLTQFVKTLFTKPT